MNLRRLLSQAALLIGALLFSAGLQTFAFTQPSTSPPNADAYAPLTTSPTAQSKVGGLLLNTGGATNGLIVQSGNVGIGVSSPSQQLDVAGYVKGSGLCIGGDCRTSWTTSSAETDPTVQSWAKTTSPSIPGNLSVGGSLQASGGTPIYQCPANANGLCRAQCVGQLSTFPTCTNYHAYGQGCNTPGTYSCSLVGRLVSP